MMKPDAAAVQTSVVWQVPGKPVSVELHANVIKGIEREVMEGFQALPKRGAEVGGILLGQVEHENVRRVRIDSFQPVHSEHRSGPSYVLSDTDKRKLEDAVSQARARWHSVVGYYRSHTRKGLYLDDEDYALAATYFSDPDNVFLLIKPIGVEESVAGFFFWEEGEIRRQSSYLEFAFGHRHAGKPVAALKAAEQAQQAAEYLPASEGPATPEEASTGTRSKRLALAISGIVVGIAALAYLAFKTVSGSDEVSPAPPISSIDLTLERTKGGLRVSWNPHSAALRSVQQADLTITDGPRRKLLVLDSDQIRKGSILYAPATDEVAVRIELSSGGQKFLAESVRMMLSSAPPMGSAEEATKKTVRPAGKRVFLRDKPVNVRVKVDRPQKGNRIKRYLSRLWPFHK